MLFWGDSGQIEPPALRDEDACSHRAILPILSDDANFVL